MNLETLDDIRNLINSGTETDSIEFKKTTGQLERGMETLCAFLNGTGGTVLFGRDFYYYPQCLLRLARFKGTTKDEFIDNQRVTGNIYTLLDAAMAFFFKHLSLSGKIEGLYRKKNWKYPTRL